MLLIYALTGRLFTKTERKLRSKSSIKLIVAEGSAVGGNFSESLTSRTAPVKVPFISTLYIIFKVPVVVRCTDFLIIKTRILRTLMSVVRRASTVEKMIAKKTSVSSREAKVSATKASWPIPSLRLVIVCVSLAVALTMSALIIFVDVSAPSLADIFLSSIYFPLGQGLQLKTRRWSLNKTECVQFFKPTRDDNFWRFGGIQCGQAVWQSTANAEEKDRYVRKISTHYRLFENDALASQYFQGYWHEKGKDVLPVAFYTEETENSPKAGDDFQAFRWDPHLNNFPSEVRGSSWSQRAASTARHIIYIFR